MTKEDLKHLSVWIDASAERVYRFASDPNNLPAWVPSFVISVAKSDQGWMVNTPDGPMQWRFVEQNDLGVLDHFVRPKGKEADIYNPMRVISAGSGSLVTFTLFRLPEMSGENFENDAKLVISDLTRLKALIEQGDDG